MKRVLTKLGLVFVFLISCSVVTFTACSSDDDGEEDVKKTSTITYSYEVSENLLSVADVTISYADANGQTVEEVLTSTTWKKSVTMTYPCTFSGYTVTMSMKDVTLSEETYTIECKHNVSVVRDGNIAVRSFTTTDKKACRADALERYLTDMSGKTYGTCSLDAEGKYVE